MSIDLKVKKVLEDNKERFRETSFRGNLNVDTKSKKTILYPINEMRERVFSYNGINRDRIRE